MHILPPINCLDEELNLYLKILAPSSFLHLIILWRFCFNFFGIGKETEHGVTCRREARSVGKKVHTTFVIRWSRFDKPNNFRYICTLEYQYDRYLVYTGTSTSSSRECSTNCSRIATQDVCFPVLCDERVPVYVLQYFPRIHRLSASESWRGNF